VVTATGDIVATAGMDERAVLVGTVRPERRATTLALAWGDWLGPVALVAAAVLIGGGRRSS
jgi:apolipoprotein N-acyltransferase